MCRGRVERSEGERMRTALEHRKSATRAWRDVASMDSLGKPPRTVHMEAGHDSPCHARLVLQSQARRRNVAPC